MEVSLADRKKLAKEHDLSMVTMNVYEEVISQYKPGEAVPYRTVSSIASELGVSRDTVRKALTKLCQAGILENRNGYYVPIEADKLDSEHDQLTKMFQIYQNYPDYMSWSEELYGPLNVLNPKQDYTIYTTSDRTSIDPSIFNHLDVKVSTKDGTITTTLSTKNNSIELLQVPEEVSDRFKRIANGSKRNHRVISGSEQTTPNDFILDRSSGESEIDSGRTTEDTSGELGSTEETSEKSSSSLSPSWYGISAPDGYVWDDLFTELKSPLVLERVLELGPDHWEVRKRYKEASEEFQHYLIGLRDDDPLETFDASPYKSVNEMIGAERTALEYPPDVLGKFRGRGKELVGRWKARRNRSLTFDQFLEYILMNDLPKPSIDSPSYHVWFDVFTQRKNEL